MTNNLLNIFQIKDDCTGCGACVSVCPKHCLRLDYDEEGFLFPQGDLANCINCRLCERVCHVIQSRVKKDLTKPLWWDVSVPLLFINKDEIIREKSTSGGAMSLFAQRVIDQGGVVFSSHYNGEQKRLEYASTDEYPLSDFRKSRYFESNTNDVFPRVKAELNKGRKVLFVGTPCQVSGLKSFLGDNCNLSLLLTINFVCHGVPSNLFFHNYVENRYHMKDLQAVDFRYKDKKHGWHGMFLKIENSTDQVIVPFGEDPFYLSFTHNEYFRRSCYSCNYLFNNFADITIADFWGVRRYKECLDDNKGVSLIILHNKKAELFLDLLNKSGICERLSYKSIEYLLAERASFSLDIRYKGHFENLYKTIITEYKKEIWKNKIRRMARNIMGR